MYCKSISYISALTVNVYYIYWHWLLTVTTDYWSRIPVGASSSHRVCSPSAPSRRPTPPSNFSLSAIHRFSFCAYLYPQCVVLTSHFAFYYIFSAVIPPLYRFISAILYIFQLYCRPISFSFLIHTSGNVNITDYHTDRHVGLYGFYWSAHLVSWFLLWCCSPWFLLWCSFRSGSMSLAHTQTHPPTIN